MYIDHLPSRFNVGWLVAEHNVFLKICLLSS